MTNTKEIIIKLKEVREERGLSFQNILDLMEQNGDFLSKSTLSRVFADGSEEKHFKYEETIRPIAKVILDIEHIEDDDTTDVQAMKTILRYKMERITELEQQIAKLNLHLEKEQLKYHEKLEKERDSFKRSISFLRDQIDLKDKRMDFKDQLLLQKENLVNDILQKLLSKCDNCKFNTSNQ